MGPSYELLAALVLIASCHEDDEEEEERDQNRDNYWRAQIVIVGAGTVRAASEVFDCIGDGRVQVGFCGPTLVAFDELHPPLLRAYATPGWRFDHWEASIRSPYGFVHKRRGPMPDGAFYMNGFGYTDTGELETVRAVFVVASATNSSVTASPPVRFHWRDTTDSNKPAATSSESPSELFHARRGRAVRL